MRDTSTEKVFKVKEIAGLLQARENMTLVSLPGGGKTRLAHNFQDKEMLSGLLPDKQLEKIVFLHIDQNIGQTYIVDHFNTILRQYSEKQDLLSKLFDIIGLNYRVVFIIDNFKLDNDFFKFIYSLRNVSINKIQFMFLTSASDFLAIEKSAVDLGSVNFMFHNVVYLPYPSYELSIEWVKEREIELNFKVSDGDVNKILDFSGRVPSLIKNYLRTLRNYKNHEKTIRSAEFKIILSKFWNSFTKEEKQILKGINMGILKNLTSKQQEIVDYMINLGLLNQERKICGKWINYVNGENQEVKLDVFAEKILVQGIDVTERFTQKELLFLNKISAVKLLQREEVSRTILGEQASDWTIDKFVSRLRMKLKDLSLDPKTIKTIKGVGYKL